MKQRNLREILAQLDRCNWLLLSTRRGKLQIAGFHDQDNICAYRMKALWREPLLAWMDGDGNAVPFEYLHWHEDIHRQRDLGTTYPGAVYVRPSYANILQRSTETAQQTGTET